MNLALWPHKRLPLIRMGMQPGPGLEEGAKRQGRGEGPL